MPYRISSPLVLTLAVLAVPPVLAGQDASPRVAVHGTVLLAPPEVSRLLDPFRGDPDAAEVAHRLAEAGRDAGFPQGAADAVLVARSWRRAGEDQRALETLEAIPMAETSSLALLERARVLLESDTDREGGTRAYWAACEQLDPGGLTDLTVDLLAVSTPAERRAWADAGEARSGCSWLLDFWSERAQRMAISTDERVALHYRRLAHARDWYWIPRPRYEQSWADKLGRPEGLALDDRGLMYVRMGPPETDEGFIGLDSEGVDVEFQVADVSNEAVSFLTGVPDDALNERRCWPYPRPDGYRIYCFSQTSVSGHERADGDYKLLQGVVGVPGTSFFHRYVANSNLPSSWRRDRVRARTIGFGLADPWERDLDRIETRAYDRRADLTTRSNIVEAVAQVPDVPSIRPSARLRVETLRFLNPGDDSWQVWTLAGVRAGDLRAVPDERGVPTIVAGGRFSVRSGTDVEIHQLQPVSVPEASARDDDGLVFRSVFQAAPGPLPLTVVIEDGNWPNAGNYLLDTINVPAIGGLPLLSDIAVAQTEGGDWTRDGQTYLAITPAHVTNPDGSIHTYFEVYQVRPGTTYEVDVRMAALDLTDEILRLDAEDLDFRLQFGAEMSGPIGRHHLRLDLRDTAPGEYSLAVRVRDVATGAYSLPSITEVFVSGR